MADGTGLNTVNSTHPVLSLDQAIKDLKDGLCQAAFTVSVDGSLLEFTEGDIDSGSALQRLTGLSRLLRTPLGGGEKVQALRSGKPLLHPRVADILDALRQKG